MKVILYHQSSKDYWCDRLVRYPATIPLKCHSRSSPTCHRASHVLCQIAFHASTLYYQYTSSKLYVTNLFIFRHDFSLFWISSWSKISSASVCPPYQHLLPCPCLAVLKIICFVCAMCLISFVLFFYILTGYFPI